MPPHVCGNRHRRVALAMHEPMSASSIVELCTMAATTVPSWPTVNSDHHAALERGVLDELLLVAEAHFVEMALITRRIILVHAAPVRGRLRPTHVFPRDAHAASGVLVRRRQSEVAPGAQEAGQRAVIRERGGGDLHVDDAAAGVDLDLAVEGGRQSRVASPSRARCRRRGRGSASPAPCRDRLWPQAARTGVTAQLGASPARRPQTLPAGSSDGKRRRARGRRGASAFVARITEPSARWSCRLG